MTEPAGKLPAFERTLIRAMLTAVAISASCLAAGLALMLVSRAPDTANMLLNVGLIVLMATPAMRVVLSIAEAVRQRDWFWLWTTVAVAVVLSGTVFYSLRTLK